jgi:hypothetical protein
MSPMSIEPGTRLKQYRIAAPIGAGGMGEVYQARDTNLEREVAVKVLPASVAENPTLLARLEREAKVVAALSHPNILAVYDFGVEDGVAFVVTELLTGETLRDRVAAGALPPRKATELGRQIARGLAAAHDRGVVHRDLKPENLFLTRDGRVKILDFGLATAADGAQAPDDSPAPEVTIEMRTRTDLTAPGTVLGTVDYMSPEQVRGKPTDNRSDLFSFGSVLYEMLTGQRPYHRETGPETMTAILREDPAEIATLAPDVPPALAAIVRRCLEKQPGERFHSAHDLAFSLEALSGSTVSTGTAAALADVAPARRRPGTGLVLMCVLAGLAIGAAGAWFLRPAPPPAEVQTYDALSSRRGTVTNGRFAGGGDVLYSAAWEGGPVRIYPAQIGSANSDPLNMVSADLLSVSSTGALAVALDRRFPLGWEAIGTLAVAQTSGEAPRPLLENVLVADWGPDGTTLAVAHEVDGVVRLEYPIGTVLYESPGWISDLRVHPDGEKVLIADGPVRGDNIARAKIVYRDGRIEELDLLASWGLLWSPDGKTVWASNGNRIHAAGPGEAARLIQGMTSSLRLLDVTPEGRLLCTSASIRRGTMLHTAGSESDRDLSWQDWTTPRTLSRDGRLMAFEEGNDVRREGYAIFVRQTDGSPPLKMGYGSIVALSPDGKWLATVRNPFGDEGEIVLLPIGPGEFRQVDLGGLKAPHGPGAWLPAAGPDDRGSLVFVSRAGDGPTRLYELPLGGGQPRAVTPAELALAPNGHVVSPDGLRFIARPVAGPPVEFGRDGQGPSPVPGLQPGDLPLSFADDNRHLFVQGTQSIPSPIDRVDTVTGRRERWLELAPGDAAGVVAVDRVSISGDGATAIYGIRRHVSRLMVREQ